MMDWIIASLPKREDATFWMSIVSFVISSALAIAKGVEFFGERRISVKIETRFGGWPSSETTSSS
jgi:acid phosphatase family membrane protein YuiD